MPLDQTSSSALLILPLDVKAFKSSLPPHYIQLLQAYHLSWPDRPKILHSDQYFQRKMARADHFSWNIGPLDQFFRQTKISVTVTSSLLSPLREDSRGVSSSWLTRNGFFSVEVGLVASPAVQLSKSLSPIVSAELASHATRGRPLKVCI